MGNKLLLNFSFILTVFFGQTKQEGKHYFVFFEKFQFSLLKWLFILLTSAS